MCSHSFDLGPCGQCGEPWDKEHRLCRRCNLVLCAYCAYEHWLEHQEIEKLADEVKLPTLTVEEEQIIDWVLNSQEGDEVFLPEEIAIQQVEQERWLTGPSVVEEFVEDGSIPLRWEEFPNPPAPRRKRRLGPMAPRKSFWTG